MQQQLRRIEWTVQNFVQQSHSARAPASWSPPTFLPGVGISSSLSPSPVHLTGENRRASTSLSPSATVDDFPVASPLASEDEMEHESMLAGPSGIGKSLINGRFCQGSVGGHLPVKFGAGWFYWDSVCLFRCELAYCGY